MSPRRVARGPQRPGRAMTALVLVMVLIGLVMILSASSIDAFNRYGSFFAFFNRQAIVTALGIAAMVALSRLDYRKLRPLAPALLLGTLALLVVVLVAGITRGGSSRWLVLGPFTFQPSEAAKLALILFAARAMDRKKRPPRELRELKSPLVPAALACFLIVIQPDLGTALIAAICVLIVVYLGGAAVRHVTGIASAGVLATMSLIFLEGYRRTRLLSFLDPWSDPLNSGYQSVQGQIAMGSGGWFGVGLGASRQKWSYVPNAHTDFIYAILGEEMGLAGTLTVLGLFALFVYLGVLIARRAPDRFGLLLAGGITAWVGVQAVVNMGAVTGLLPITGVPLPLISFGGSSLIFLMSAIGILLSIARRSRRAGARA